MSYFGADWLRKASVAEGTTLEDEHTPSANLDPLDKHALVLSPEDESVQPFSSHRYSRELLLSLFKPLPVDKAKILEDVYVEVSQGPVADSEMSELEKQIFASGNVNSDIASKRAHQQRGRGKGRGRGEWNPKQQPRSQRSLVSPSAEEPESPIPDDIWDLPTKAGTGSFANGAFTLDGGSAAAPLEPVLPKDNTWKPAPAVKQNAWETGMLKPIQQQISAPQQPLISQQSLQQRFHSELIHQAPQQHSASMLPPQQPPQEPFRKPQQPPVEPVWFYKDPQGNVQGPFLGREMQQWFEVGYFPDQLLIKQGTDTHFDELVVYMQRFGGQVTFLRSSPPVRQQPPQQLQQSPQMYNSPYMQQRPILPPQIPPQQVPSRAQPWKQAHQQEPGWSQQDVLARSPELWAKQKTQEDIEEFLVAERNRAIQQQQQIAHHQQIALQQKQAAETKAISPQRLSPQRVSLDAEFTEKVNLRDQSPVSAQWSPRQDSPIKDEKPAWGGLSSSKPKTLAEIQREEAEIARKQSEQQQQQAKMYAELAKSAGSVWGAKPASAVVAQVKQQSQVSLKRNESKSSSIDSLYTAPSKPGTPLRRSEMDLPKEESVVKWMNDQLRSLEGRMDVHSFIEILMPISDPLMISEVIHDSIGENFHLVNPQRLTQEFIEKRHKQGVIKQFHVPPPPEHSVYAAHLKKAQAGDKGFVPVVSKKKKKAKEQTRNSGAPVGVGGRPVVGATGLRDSK